MSRLGRSRVIVLGLLAICCIIVLIALLHSSSESESNADGPVGTGEIDRNIELLVPSPGKLFQCFIYSNLVTYLYTIVMIMAPTPSPTVFT